MWAQPLRCSPSRSAVVQTVLAYATAWQPCRSIPLSTALKTDSRFVFIRLPQGVLSGTFVEAMGKRFHVDHFNCGKCKANIGAPPPPCCYAVPPLPLNPFPLELSHFALSP